MLLLLAKQANGKYRLTALARRCPEHGLAIATYVVQSLNQAPSLLLARKSWGTLPNESLESDQVSRSSIRQIVAICAAKIGPKFPGL